MPLSIHDNRLISYEVQCEARTIIIHTENRDNNPTEFAKVIFNDVQGYRFENDAFGNIIFGLEAVPVEQFLEEYRAEISESYHSAGSPGPWAANLGAAAGYLREQGIQGFVLSSSYGLSGWVLAQAFSILPDEQGHAADHL